MDIPLIVLCLSIIVWFFPPFRQRKTEYLLFFVIVAITDPISLFLFYFFKVNPLTVSPFFSLLLYSSIIKSKKKSIAVIIAFISLLLCLDMHLGRSLLLISIVVIHILIAFIIVIRFTRCYFEKYSLNLFLFLLSVYEFLIIFKFTAAILAYEQGAISFYLASFSAIFLGILFSFITIDSNNFYFSHKK